jgi:RNA-binding protein YhbY
VDRALIDHELVKIRARVGDRDERDSMLAELALADARGTGTAHSVTWRSSTARTRESRRIILPG